MTRNTLLVTLTGLIALAEAGGQPELTSWFTENSGRYARLYEDNSAFNNGTPVTTWSRGQGTQSQPTYAGIHEISYSASWVYIRTTGLASYPMGPWYLNEGDTQNFPNYPSNTSSIYRIPRSPSGAVKTPTGLGAIGYFVDGVAMFDSRDAFSYDTSAGQDDSPNAGTGVSGDGVWNRDAYVNEGVTFDAGNAHQAGNRYHYHANPPGLRNQLGDHVDYDEGTRTYSERTALPTEHSPILGWMADGYPIYGPYGYSVTNNASSGIRRMVSGFRKRSIAVREILPAYAARDQGYTSVPSTATYTLPASLYGPAVNAQFPIGHFLEDYEYLGDFGQTQGVDFDLDEHNGRHCWTPEFPGPVGTYAYFVAVESDGAPRFPYNIGRTYYGNPTGGSVNNITEPVEILFEGGPEKAATITPASQIEAGAVQTLVWTPTEGGTYTIQYSDDLTDTNAWVLLTSDVSPTNLVEATPISLNPAGGPRYYRIQQQAVATFDSAGFQIDGGGDGGGGTPTDPGVHPDTGSRGTTVAITIIFDAGITPPLPPDHINPSSVTIGGVTLTGVTRPDQTTLTGTLVIPPGAAAGPQAAVITFPGPPPYNFANAFTFE